MAYNFFFPHSVGCLFTFLVSFAVQKVFSLTQSQLVYFYFIAYALGVIFKKTPAEIHVRELFSYVFF